MNYYNEFDPFAAAWLRELIKEGLIPDGEVDERSIVDVDGKDLKGFTQCHFFTGIGGWSYALELAGWEPTRPVWTGSPPCQPFSVAGNKKGQDDERHLWPHFFNLIRECKPATVFGEQVASAIRTGWFDDLQTDMENEGYATAMAVLPACSVGAPHKRERLFFVADSGGKRLQGCKRSWETGTQRQSVGHTSECCDVSMADSMCINGRTKQESRQSERGEWWKSSSDSSELSSLADSINSGQSASTGRRSSSESSKSRYNPWWGCQTIECRDGKTREIPTEPTLFPLANGIPNRVGLLRGAGNAIVPQVAAEVIKAYMDYASQESQM
jgi:DNA (cytosine-5)-methyltransferase 1